MNPGVRELIEGEVARLLNLRPASFELLFVNGWRMDLSALTALVFERGLTRPTLVVKAAAGAERAGLHAERDNLELLARASLPELTATVPRVLAHLELGSTALLVESALPGSPFDGFRSARRIAGFVSRAAEWLLLFHRGTPVTRRPLEREDLDRHFVRPIEEYLRRFEPGASERAFLGRALAEAEGWKGAVLPLVFHHDDYCPQNLLVDGERLSVIDWETPFVHRPPLYDLIHLLACLGVGRTRDGRGDHLESYERVFFEDNPVSRAARAAVRAYAREMAVPAEAVRLLFTVYWVEYALEKAAALATLRHRAGAPPDDLGVWSLARFEDNTCLNLKLLAERERNLVLP